MPVIDPDRKIISTHTTDSSDIRPTFALTQDDVDRMDELADEWGITRSELIRASIIAGLHKLGVSSDNSTDENAQSLTNATIEGEILDILRQNPGLSPDEIKDELTEHVANRTGVILDELANEKQLIQYSAAKGGYVID